MSCLCKNPDGTFAQYCNGTCMQKQYVEESAVQMRSDKSIEDRLEYLLGVFLKQLDERIKKMQEVSMNKYREGYKDGFFDGRES